MKTPETDPTAAEAAISRSPTDAPLRALDKFHINNDVISARLQFLQLEGDDHQRIEELQNVVIRPNVDSIVEAFYARLHQYNEAALALSKVSDLNKLKRKQRDYLLSLGVSFDQKAYWESRLQVGMTHLRVGISLQIYQYAFYALHQILLNYIPEDYPHTRKLVSTVLKIHTLDVSLAIEAYESNERFELGARINALTHRQKTLQKKADIDSLTGVLRRQSILDLVEDRLKSLASDEQVFVLLIDLDHFKKVNDTYGHLVGDRVLTDVVNRIRATVRQVNPIGRYGGEEFLVLLSDADQAQALAIAERARARVAAHPIRTDDQEIPVTVSIGIGYSSDQSPLNQLIDNADKALYMAKNRGRNRVVLAPNTAP